MARHNYIALVLAALVASAVPLLAQQFTTADPDIQVADAEFCVANELVSANELLVNKVAIAERALTTASKQAALKLQQQTAQTQDVLTQNIGQAEKCKRQASGIASSIRLCLVSKLASTQKNLSKGLAAAKKGVVTESANAQRQLSSALSTAHISLQENLAKADACVNGYLDGRQPELRATLRLVRARLGENLANEKQRLGNAAAASRRVLDMSVEASRAQMMAYFAAAKVRLMEGQF